MQLGDRTVDADHFLIDVRPYNAGQNGRNEEQQSVNTAQRDLLPQEVGSHKGNGEGDQAQQEEDKCIPCCQHQIALVAPVQVRPDVLDVILGPVGRLLAGDGISTAKLEGHQNRPEINADIEHDKGNNRNGNDAIHEDTFLQYVPLFICQTH